MRYSLMRDITLTIFFRLFCLSGFTIVSTYLFIANNYLWGILTALCAIAFFILVYSLYQEHTQKTAFLLEAIENDDSSFKFIEGNLSTDDKTINHYLNRITQILYEAKIEVAKKEQFHELILNSINTGIIVIDSNCFILQTNNEALQLLGLSTLTHIKQIAQRDQALAGIISNIRPKEKKQYSYSNDLGTINLSIRASEIAIGEKELRIIVLNDVKNELEEKEIDSWIRLTRILTHEIMNSITPITSISDTLLSMSKINKEISIGLETISNTGKSLISFVESYRQFTHIPQPEPGLFYVNKFIERMVELAKHQSQNNNISFHIHTEPDNLILYADENLISQVFINLLKNAIQAVANRPEGLIAISASNNELDEVIIEIKNNGPAIQKEIAEHIFIPFFTTKDKGSGVGLSISRQIMRLSGGSLYLKLSSKEEGTVFVLEFK